MPDHILKGIITQICLPKQIKTVNFVLELRDYFQLTAWRGLSIIFDIG